MSNQDIQTILEHFDSKIDVLLENIDTKIDQKLAPLQSDISELKIDMKVVKRAVTDTNRDITDHEQRIQKLEAAA